MLSRDLRIIKSNQYTIDYEAFELALVPQKAPFTSIIKRYQIDYSYEQKYKLGIMTAAEYIAWQTELYEKAQREALEESEKKSRRKDHTFWEDDEGVRENVSEDEYDSFLAQNDLDVTNNTLVDVDAIIRANEDARDEQAEESMQDAEESMQAAESEPMLISDDLPGSDDPNRVLTPEEIAALFAAMGTN